MDRTDHLSDEQQALEREKRMTLSGAFEEADLSFVDDLVQRAKELKEDAAASKRKAPHENELEVGK